jgi:hypothetical protein
MSVYRHARKGSRGIASVRMGRRAGNNFPSAAPSFPAALARYAFMASTRAHNSSGIGVW